MDGHVPPSTTVGCPWVAMVYHGLPGATMDYHGLPWALHGLPWTTVGYHGLPNADHGLPRATMDYRRGLAMGCHWSPWAPMGFSQAVMDDHRHEQSMVIHGGRPWADHGDPWRSMDSPWRFNGPSMVVQGVVHGVFMAGPWTCTAMLLWSGNQKGE